MNDNEKDIKTEEKEGTVKETMLNRVEQATRIYDAANLDGLVPSGHKWIDDGDEQVIKPISSNTYTGLNIDRQTLRDLDRLPREGLDRNTRIGRSSNTIIARRPAPVREEVPDSDRGAVSFREAAGAAVQKGRSIAGDLRNIKVGDQKKFSRFLKIIGVFALILLLELGYFRFAAKTAGMPDEIEKAQKELELTKKENELLSQQIEALGDYDSAEEQKQSWQRLKEQVENAAAETYY